MATLDYPDFSSGLVNVANSAIILQPLFVNVGGVFASGIDVAPFSSIEVSVAAMWNGTARSQVELIITWYMSGQQVAQDVYSQFDDGGVQDQGITYYQLPVKGDQMAMAFGVPPAGGQTATVTVVGSSRVVPGPAIRSLTQQDLLVDAWASPVQVPANSMLFYPVGPFARGVHINVIGPANTSYARARVPSLSSAGVWNNTYAGGIYCTNSIGAFADIWVPNRCMLIEVGNDMSSPQLIYFTAIGIT